MNKVIVSVRPVRLEQKIKKFIFNFMFALFLLPCHSDPFYKGKEQSLLWAEHRCQGQSAQELLKGLQPIKPPQCKLSASLAQDKLFLSCKNSHDLRYLQDLLSSLDQSREMLRLKVHWVVLQEHCAQDLLKIFIDKDLNLKNAWKALLESYKQRGFALTLASPEIQTLTGTSFELHTQEVFKQPQERDCREKRARKRQDSKLGLLLQGQTQKLEHQKYLITLNLKHHSDTPQETQEPGHTQTLKTQLILEKNMLICLGEIYQHQAFEEQRHSVFSQAVEFVSGYQAPKVHDKKYVSMVFFEIL